MVFGEGKGIEKEGRCGMKAYEGTQTSVAKSQEDIRWILRKYGADGVQFSEDWKEQKIFIRFLHTIGPRQYSLLFKVPIPKAEERTPSRGFRRSETKVQEMQEKIKRGIWRAVYWAIKSRMEAVEFGIETFEQAFLAHFEISPGREIGEIIIPRLASGDLRSIEQ